MRKPREAWTPQEQEEIEQKAAEALIKFAASGDDVSYEVCYMLAELGYVQVKLNEVKAGLRRIFNE